MYVLIIRVASLIVGMRFATTYEFLFTSLKAFIIKKKKKVFTSFLTNSFKSWT